MKDKHSTIIAQLALQELETDPYTLPQILASSNKEGSIRTLLSNCSSRFNQEAASTLAKEFIATQNKLAAETASREGLQRKLTGKSYHRLGNISKKLGRRCNGLGVLQEQCDTLSTKLGELEKILERTGEATLKGEKVSLQKEVHSLQIRLKAHAVHATSTGCRQS